MTPDARTTAISGKSTLVMIAATVFTLLITTSLTAKEPAAIVTEVTIAKVVSRHLHAATNYQTGDLISRKNAEPIFNELLKLGIQPSNEREDIYDSFLMETSYAVTVLSSQNGKEFLRKVKHLPGAYDLLERLSWFPEGKEVLYHVVNAKEGPRQFAAMLTPAGRQATQANFAQQPKAQNLFLPTGHIYTEQDLLRRIQAVRQSAQRVP